MAIKNLTEGMLTVPVAPQGPMGIGPEPTLTFIVSSNPFVESVGYRLSKRIFDVVVALSAIALLSPLLLIVCVLIYLDDHGPIIYRQWRVGRYGVPIPFYKFRSMCMDADKIRAQLLAQSDAKGVAFKMKNDPRVTKIGKFIRKYSIDEMPQLFSVLSGYMSIVGPRPLPLSEGYECAGSQRLRYLVKPGLVCFREIGGRSLLTFDQWMELDEKYVRSQSFWTDLSIFVRLIPAVLGAKGAF
jgi:lipopolysaccharide/colanic/teichoic acid biosynthesis glycosyltransferase